MNDSPFLFFDEVCDLLYRSVFTAVIALFAFFEIYNTSDEPLITAGNIISLIVISISFNALLLIYRKVRLYILPAAMLVGIILYFTVDKDDMVAMTESVMFSLLIIGLAAFVIFLICDRFVVLNIILSTGALVYTAMSLITGNGIYKASPPLVIFYAVFLITRLIRGGTGPAEIKRTRLYVTFLLPFMLAYLVVLIVLPKPEKPVSWQWVKNLYEHTVERIDRIVHIITTRYGRLDADHFTISFGMEEKMTYDNRRHHESELFEVTPSGNVAGSVYLKGEVFNLFRNGTWYNTLDTDRDYSMTDAAETRAGVDRYDAVPYGSVMRDASIRIKFLDIVSGIVFAPSKITGFEDVSTGKRITGTNEHLTFSGNVSYGGEYNVSFLQLNLGNTVFTDYMKESFDPEKQSYDGLEAYREYIRENYTSAPVVSGAVKDWIEEVTKGAGTDYERLCAVEEALSGFAYDIRNEELPAYVKSEGDFIDYFLLETREGYCVHYATVFCLLARYMGFPARVVQGYKADIRPGQTAVITDSCGHSWPEVYFTGKGWIPFEPTPGMALERYAGWEVESGRVRNTIANAWKYGDDEAAAYEEEQESDTVSSGKMTSWILILAIVGVIVISLALTLAARMIFRKRKLKRMSREERFFMEFKTVLKYLKELGLTRKPEETLAEFASRSGSEEFAGCVEKYERCVYGNKALNAKDITALEECRSAFDNSMKQRFGKMYPIHKFKLML